MLVTLEETVLGFLIGAVLGIVCGIVLGRDKLLADVFSIYIKIANSIPRIVLGSIFVIALGLGMQSKVALAVVMVFFVVFANAFQGVREADRALIANARILGASPWQVTHHGDRARRDELDSRELARELRLRARRRGGGRVSRLAARSSGLLIATEQGLFSPAGVFAAMIVLAVVALAADYVLTWAERRLLKWRPPAFTESARDRRDRWPAHLDGEPAAGPVGERHRGAVRVGDLFHDREAEPAPFRLVARDAVEPLERERALRGWYSGAAVLHAQHGGIRVALAVTVTLPPGGV